MREWLSQLCLLTAYSPEIVKMITLKTCHRIGSLWGWFVHSQIICVVTEMIQGVVWENYGRRSWQQSPEM